MAIFQHPLAYALGLEGLALLRSWAGDFDEAFTRERLAAVRRLVDDPLLSEHPGVTVARGSTADGYRQWAATYDEPNGLFDLDEPFVHGIVDGLPAGVAVDAACGTGRFAAGLARRGHQVIGIDGSAEMLERARLRVPEAEFQLGDLAHLPLADASADVVVCSLALSHLESLDPPMAEFARVLRPGGHLIISDVHAELVLRGSVVLSLGPDGEPGQVPTYRHSTGDFLRSALPQGFTVLRCEEPGAPSDGGAPVDAPAPTPSAEVDLDRWNDWPWSMLGLDPRATAAAWAIPCLVNLHFRR